MEYLIPILGALFVTANVIFGMLYILYKVEKREKELGREKRIL